MRCLIPRMLFYVLALNFEVAEGAKETTGTRPF